MDRSPKVVQRAVFQGRITSADEEAYLVGIEQTVDEKGGRSGQHMEQTGAVATQGKHGRHVKTTKEGGAIENLWLFFPIFPCTLTIPFLAL